jgi:hypothetical protein
MANNAKMSTVIMAVLSEVAVLALRSMSDGGEPAKAIIRGSVKFIVGRWKVKYLTRERKVNSTHKANRTIRKGNELLLIHERRCGDEFWW